MDGYEKTPDKWILSVHSKSLIKSLVIPHRIIGNEVILSSSSFYNAKLSTVTIAPGYTSLPDRLFSSVESLSTLNIPSTVTSLGDWMFNAKFADTLKIYCESSISNGHWNQISGTTRYFTTYINATGAASSTIRDGYTARITQDGAYIVSCVNGTTTPIPKSVFFGIIEYPVVGLYEGALNNYAGEKLFIDKGITTLFPTSFNRNIAVITKISCLIQNNKTPMQEFFAVDFRFSLCYKPPTKGETFGHNMITTIQKDGRINVLPP